MNRILIIALAIILSILLLAPNATEIGPILIEMFGYRIATNSLFLSAMLIVALLAFKIFITIPRAYNYYYHKLFSKDAAALLADFVLATATSNEKTAKSLLPKIEKLNLTPALTCLLKIQAFKKRFSTDLQLALEEALNYPVIAPLALKELINTYITQGQWHKANIAADQLWSIQHSHWLVAKKILLLFKLEAWDEVLNFVEKAIRVKLISKVTASQLKAVALYKTAQSLQFADQAASLELLDNVCNIYPAFIQPSLLLLEIELTAGNYKSFIKHATRAWDVVPNSALAMQIIKLSKSFSADEFLDACRTITKNHKNNYESLLLMAEALILADNYENANKLLQQALLCPHEQRVYILLAKCYHKMRASSTQVYNWLDQATTAHTSSLSIEPYPEEVITLLQDAERKPLEQ